VPSFRFCSSPGVRAGRPPAAGARPFGETVRTQLEKSRVLWENAILSAVLPFVAGMVNASGFIALGVYTSHATGNTARIGDELAQGHFDLALQYAGLVFLFCLGAMTATALVEVAHRLKQPRFVGALLLQAFLLGLFALLSIHSERHWSYQRFELTSLLCFSMGLQNAMVTRLSGAVIRTTHLTGITTDIGIETTRTLFWLFDRGRGAAQDGVRTPELRRLRMHLRIFGSFLAGATMGPALYLALGSISLLLPVFVLLALALVDWALGFGKAYTGQGMDSSRAQAGAGQPERLHPDGSAT
jgi:uncharacterized membrane protein YoaK (UPF0700 family)